MTYTVNTNAGAFVALQNLNRTNADLETTQNRISTGLRVSSAKDDGGTFAIAERLRADLKSLDVVSQSLSRGGSTVDTAMAAGEAVSDLLSEMKAKALAASDASLDAASRAALNEDFTALRDQITQVVTAAEFNGINLINGTTNGYTALANADGTNTLTITDENLTLGGGVLTVTGAQDISTVTEATAAVTDVETSINQLGSALARLGTSAKSVDILSDFTSKLRDETEKGIGNLVDADLAQESATLQALQVKQQLGVQALGIANQAPNAILSFFQ